MTAPRPRSGVGRLRLVVAGAAATLLAAAGLALAPAAAPAGRPAAALVAGPAVHAAAAPSSGNPSASRASASASRASASSAAKSRALASSAAVIRSSHAAATRSEANKAGGNGVGNAAGVAAATGGCQQAPTPGVSIPPLAPQDPLIEQLGLDHAWTLSQGAGVTVGVVDTGVDPSSPKLSGAVDIGRTFRVGDTKAVYTSSPGGRVDCDGHGTEVAGIIAARTDVGDDRMSGVAPAARIYPVAIQSTIGQAPSALIAAAIRDAAQHAQVINLSFAQVTDTADIRAAVAFALSRDVVVVAASANEGGGSAATSAAQKWYPAAYPGVLAVSVSATDSSGAAATGSWISLAAPGASLLTVSRGGKGFVTVSGTSFATAVVSGAAALIRARFPTMPAAEVISRLEQTAVQPGDGRRDNTVGFGTVDPYRALTLTAGDVATSAAAGAVAPQPLPSAAATKDNSGVLGTTALLVALALLVGLAALSVRAGRRRGWHAGRRQRAAQEARVAEPHPADLG